MHTLDSKLVASSVETCYMALTEINCAGFMAPLDKKVPDPWYNPMLVVLIPLTPTENFRIYVYGLRFGFKV